MRSKLLVLALLFGCSTSPTAPVSSLVRVKTLQAITFVASSTVRDRGAADALAGATIQMLDSCSLACARSGDGISQVAGAELYSYIGGPLIISADRAAAVAYITSNRSSLPATESTRLYGWCSVSFNPLGVVTAEPVCVVSNTRPNSTNISDAVRARYGSNAVASLGWVKEASFPGGLRPFYRITDQARRIELGAYDPVVGKFL